MYKKRGVLIVVLVLLMTVFTTAQEDADDKLFMEGGVTYFGASSDNPNDNCYGNKDLLPNKLGGGGDCDIEIAPWGYEPLITSGFRGCPIAMEEQDDDPGKSDASVVLVYPGVILNNNLREYKQQVVAADAWQCDDVNAEIGPGTSWQWVTNLNSWDYAAAEEEEDLEATYCHVRDKVKLAVPGSVICAPDRRWYPCTEANEGKLVWQENEPFDLYECQFRKEETLQYRWVALGTDKDHDGYTVAKGDKHDDPDLDPQYIECPKVDETELTGGELKDFREAARSLCDKNPVGYSQCAICINPGAPEVCGDKVDNDGESKTSDDCNLNQAACEQKPVYTGKEIRKCSKSDEKQCEEDSDCKTDDEYCMPPESAPAARNIYDESFSWIDTNEGGMCCGFGGVEDLGETRSNVEGDFICLNDNKDLVGMAGKFEDLVPAPQGQEPARCTGSWCWTNAIGAAQFQILTIKKPGTLPYDVVSNNQDWFICDGKTGESDKLEKPLPGGGDYDQEELEQKSNRFSCYQEGDHWSFAECTNEQAQRKEQGAKGRFAGEGRYTLPLNKGSETEDIFAERTGAVIYIHASFFDDFYGKNYLLDFTGYTHLNFMFRYIDEKGDVLKESDIKIPAAINLTILGPEDKDGNNVVYFKGSVLGNIVNSPLFGTDNYMHVKVPLNGDFKAVKTIIIRSFPEENNIAVRNVYLSKSDQPQLCSGTDSIDFSSWLKDIDQADPNIKITGQKLCSDLYGDKAWLGNDDVVLDPSASCCGNTQGEYYAGPSMEAVNNPEEDEESEQPIEPSGSEKFRYGCWNSQAIASGDTIMDVQFEVDHWEEEKKTISYKDAEISPIKLGYRWRDYSAKEPYKVEDYTLGETECNAGKVMLNTEKQFAVLCQGLMIGTFPPNFRGLAELWFKDVSTDKIEISFFDMTTFEEIGGLTDSEKDPDDAEYIKEDSQYLDETDTENVWNHNIAVVARLKDKQYFTAEETEAKQNEVKGKEITFSCNKDECLFPLPGDAPPQGKPRYKITNPFPHLYELYFVTGSQKKDETLITQPKQEFQGYGNIKARKVAQQILYHNEGEDSVPETGFYACNAAQFIQDNLPKDFINYFNQPYCSVIGGKFCSYSMEQEAKQEKFTTINSWSDEEITKVGYEKIEDPDEENTSLFYSQIELQLKDKIFSPEERNHSTSVLPARNFISNAEFRTSALKILHWDIIDGNGIFVNDPKAFVKGGMITLPAGHKLRSERIAVTSETNLHFSQGNQCNPAITLVDKDGLPTGDANDLTHINTGEASYLLLEFTGPCQIEKPMLQLLDEVGAAEYYYKSQPDLDNFDARSGASCCPESYCWNGYACVEPMSELTSVAEHIEEGRDYRCVDGQWTRSSVKYDWNAQKWGFCKQESQCFVLSSEFAKDENTAGSFYDGDYPICIGNSEYIFDHYCDAGSWTSRTKFLATKMMEVAENDDYVLYCSPYRETLLDYENQESYIGGDLSQAQKSQQDISKAILGKKDEEILRTCFTTILDPQGKRLVQDEENTCINNVCVLRYKEGGRFKTAFATTLNRPLDSPKSFLLSLDVPQSKLAELCVGQQGEFVDCDLSEVNLPADANLWYSENLNAVIYSKEGLQINPGIIDKILDWFANLFGVGGKLSEENKFVDEAQNFKDLYILKMDEKGVRAVKEIFPGVKQTLVAEYEHFDTPVCEYVNNINLPPELQTELLEKVSDIGKLSCTINGTKQRVEMVEGLNFFWPQLTGKLRVS